MEIDVDKLLRNAIADGLREGVRAKLGSAYNSPLDAVLTDVLKKQTLAINRLLTESIQAVLGDAEFRQEIAGAVRQKLARALIAGFGGEIEKQVNTLKSNPVTRARITMAIEEIVKERASVS